VNQPKKYVLLLDPRQEVLNLQETAINCFYGGEVHSFANSEAAFEMLSKGHPEIIIADSAIVTANNSSFYHHLKSLNISVPLIATTGHKTDDGLMDKHPSVLAVIDKPISTASFTYLVKSLTSQAEIVPTHVPIKTSMLLRHGISPFNLFLKLADKNFVKIFHKDEAFTEADAKRLADKGVFELFIKMEDSAELLHILEKEILGEANSQDDISLSLENLESFETVAKFMGWSPNVMLAAQKSVTQAVKILSKNPNILSVLKKRLSGPSTEYSRHIGLLTYLVCAVSSTVGWIGESGQVKLALAALIHDMAVDDEFYVNTKEWNKRAADPLDKSPETLKYRMHPFAATKIVNSLDSLSPDVDQIILQHHEVKDGSGFPRGIDGHRIGQLPALFIIVEDLVEFIDNGENIETSIVDFIMWGRTYYDKGHFKKIFQAIEDKLMQP
jgi:response regulator RpfG family c-di-GMP phosphodiesterase